MGLWTIKTLDDWGLDCAEVQKSRLEFGKLINTLQTVANMVWHRSYGVAPQLKITFSAGWVKAIPASAYEKLFKTSSMHNPPLRT
ncbi:hypothetical protein BH18ACI4_BH18ACI4_09370 [soil metagenome]